MLKNYLVIAFRNFFKQKGSAFINVLGLAVGIACCLFILLYVKDELSYDRFHKRSDDIYRVVRTSSAMTCAPLAPAMVDAFPVVQKAIRIMPDDMSISRGREKRFKEDRVFFVEPEFFNIFSFPLIKGNPETVLDDPQSLVITEEMAQKYFGNENPVGQVLTVHGEEVLDLKVTGIVESAPANSHFHFDFLLSFKLVEMFSGRMDNWSTNWLYTYLLLDEGASARNLQVQLPDFFETHTGKAWNYFRIQPLTDIHLYSDVSWEIEPQSSIKYVYTFSAIAILILLIACINFMNLATARSANRAQEVGMRKVLGAHRRQLIKQFIGESFLMTFMALLLALLLVEMFLPTFNYLSGKALSFSLFENKVLLLALLAIALFVGLVAGSYPAFFLSTFQPVKVLKGRLGREDGTSGAKLRKVLVVLQFVISVFLIIGTAVVYSQLSYMQNKRLGFEKEQVVVLPIEDDSLTEDSEFVKTELLQHPDVVTATASDNVPGRGVSDFPYRLEGAQGEEDMWKAVWDTYFVDADFIETLDIELKAGRTFSKERATDSESFILNETAVKKAVDLYGETWSSPIGKQLDFYTPGQSGWEVSKQGTVIGVVKNFHYRSLHETIGPLVIQTAKSPDQLLIKIRASEISSTLGFLKQNVDAFFPGQPFEYYFLDSHFDQLYRSEQRLGEIFKYFAFLAIFIACLGLFGLAAYTAEQRTKEIGIRKVLGASVAGIVGLLSKDFVKMVLIANVIAWPIAWYAMHRWLQNFAYRIDIDWFVFALAGGLALIIALATVSSQAIKAALINPVESLRYE
ncbi:FtsX-like permease family protein [candidate division KSB1 bacterium]|nr:FtsX-like permease family protein [candidate division KSB1 bacterium]NIR70854.1 FtsX-like permease family protein [candidate division KSB1 bacterium]NIS24640.1 FtsX-like permease family protein [candidate division KSB1 bacterium]NIT71542.1 FtsX-like permease family protein [candidate division KSB1 bacterium]NIU25240.1 FtsX-like permease family protein [candidate division KSB1 bacterium]